MRHSIRIGGTVAITALGALAACVVAGAALGLERYVITGGSMGGTYERGSLLFAQNVPAAELREGEVITYEPPPEAGVEGLVTHRIVSIRENGDRRVFRTAGDANATEDPWRFELEGPEQARALFAIPFAGYPLAALGDRAVRMVVIGMPALLVAIALLVRMWREAGREAQSASLELKA